MINEIKLTARRLDLLNQLNIFDLQQLINYYPKKYEDLNKTKLNKDVDNQRVVCVGKIYSEIKNQRIRNNLSKTQFMMEIDGDIYTVTIFNREYLSKLLYMNKYIKVVGKLDYYHKTISASNIYLDLSDNVIPSYKLVEGLKDNELRKIIKEGIDYYKNGEINLDKLPLSLMEKYKLDSKIDSIELVHFPNSLKDVTRGYRHLKYEELLEFVMTLELNKRNFRNSLSEKGKNIDDSRVEEFIKNMPYKLSGAQTNSIKEILEDMKSPSIMYRIIQGDVGSGKTLVAIVALVACAFCKEQGSFMAPTDLLARQHYENIKKLLKDTDIKVELLVSDLPNSRKVEIKKMLKEGEIDIVVGTHALIQKDVEFKKLGLAIVDEQHRFGVKQRQELRNKGEKVDLLLMSATPIPRTLAHTIYGELDISTIDEFPLGKRDVKTIFVEEKNEDKMLNDISFLINQGKRVYVVCPLIEGNGNNKKSVLSTYERYKTIFKNNGVGYLHGKMDDEEKIRILDDFNKGNIDILVSTTVIEVGIDVKEATAIAIYGANHFGLAQLHQLRGRVGRNAKTGYCYLLSDNEEEESLERLRFMCTCDDGFEISRYDMKKRGVGDIIGTKQSGVSDLKIANIIDDYHILEVARKDCKTIFSNLDKLEFKEYVEYVRSKINENMEVIG